MTLKSSIEADTFLTYIDTLHTLAISQLDPASRSASGQYFTPSNVAQFMARMFDKRQTSVSILDAGAGIGMLSAASIIEFCHREQKPEQISVTAYETDSLLIGYLRQVFEEAKSLCYLNRVAFDYSIIQADFISAAVTALQGGDLFSLPTSQFDLAILNPPYRKINSDSAARKRLREIGIETSNLYTAFVWLAAKLLLPTGELASISPRSFCNGPYFRPFRQAFLDIMTFKRMHIFEARDRTFQDDGILQENIIIHACKSIERSKVTVSSSPEPDDETIIMREIDYSQLVHPGDPDSFIHVVPEALGDRIQEQIHDLPVQLEMLGLNVSTGRVVDFRVPHLLRAEPEERVIPLIYPHHFSHGFVEWPGKKYKKAQALASGTETEEILVPAGCYVLVKRFTTKEEKRRIVAAVYDPDRVRADAVGFENHLNYFHCNGSGLAVNLAKGLAAFLNSTLVDLYFRHFNGHTQVNATDLRSLRYPTREQLMALGARIGDAFPDQDELDQMVAGELTMGLENSDVPDPIEAKRKIGEALEILKALELPRAQLNDRSALTLLALANVKADTPWGEASNPLRGITEMMDYFSKYYGVQYAPNTRETVRRQTIHQFCQIGLTLINPDDPTRPTNSPYTRYQIEESGLILIQSYGTSAWDSNLDAYLASAEKRTLLQAREREMSLIPVRLPDGSTVTLTAGGQNILIKAIVEEFCPRFTPGGIIVYLDDAGQKFKEPALLYLADLGVILDVHGKMPDVIVHLVEKNWLVLIEAVTTHGPIDIKRHNELKNLFKGSLAPLVFVTAFKTRKALAEYLPKRVFHK